VDKDSAGDQTKRVDYTYDVFDRRISESVQTSSGTVATDFVYDRDDVILDFRDDDGVQGPHQPVLAERYLLGPIVDQVLAQDDGTGHVLWGLTDHQGTVRDLVGSNGAVVDHISYDSFGDVIAQSDPPAASRYLFTGREFDQQTGLYYYRARYYNSTLG